MGLLQANIAAVSYRDMLLQQLDHFGYISAIIDSIFVQQYRMM